MSRVHERYRQITDRWTDDDIHMFANKMCLVPSVHEPDHSVVQYHGTTIEPNCSTSFSRYQYRRDHGTTVVPQYHKYCGTTIQYLPTNSHFSNDFCAKNQFIDRVNKLEVSKLYIDDILVQLVSSGADDGLSR